MITKPTEFDHNAKAKKEGAREERNDEETEVGPIKGGGVLLLLQLVLLLLLLLLLPLLLR